MELTRQQKLAQQKTERKMGLKYTFDAKNIERTNRYEGANLYIKNLEKEIDDEILRSEFSKFGTITSAKVMKDDKGNSKGFGFVCFSSPDEATKALTEMNGRILVTKRLYVALAPRKEERRRQLSTQFMQRVRPLRYNTSVNTEQPGYSFQDDQPGFYIPTMPQGQCAFIINPVNQITRPRWRSLQVRSMGSGPYPQQVVQIRGGSPRGAPINIQRLDGAYQPGMGRNMGNQQVMRPAGPSVQPQRAAYKLNANTRIQYAPQQVIAPPQPNEASVMPQGCQEPLTASILATATPSEQKQMIGERLFPLVQEYQPHLAGKITGMLLEIDNTELLHMLESRELLCAKVEKAVQVLQAHQAKEADAQAAETVVEKK